MKILLYDSFTILTSDVVAVVMERLNANIEEKKVFRFSRKHAPYEGIISETGFQINRIIHGKNSFLPMIKGRFEAQSHQTAVHIQMEPRPFVMPFVVLWFCFWYSISIPLALLGSMPTIMTVLHLGMPIVTLTFFSLAFWKETNRSRSELAKIIHGNYC